MENESRQSYGGTSYESQHPLFSSPQQPAHLADTFSALPLSSSSNTFPPQQPSPYPTGQPSQSYGSYRAKEETSGDELQGRRTQNGRSKEEGAKKRGRFGSFVAGLNTRNQIAFLCLIFFQALAVLTMIALIYATVNTGIGADIPAAETFENAPKLESVSTYLGLFILAELFEIGVSLDALSQKNIMQLAMLVPFQVAMLVYSSVLPSQLREAISGTQAATPSVFRHVRAYSIVIPGVVGAVTLVMVFLLWKLYEEFGWEVFKKLGADIRVKRMYIVYQIYITLLKFDAFFFIGFSIQFLVLVSATPTAEKVITIAALPIIMVCLGLAAYVIRIESRAGTYAWFVLQMAGMAYFIYKLVRIFSPSSGERYESAKKTLTIFSILSFLMLLATFIVTGLCYANFDRGLKEAIPPYSWGRRTRKKVDAPEKVGAANDDGRMTLD